MTDCCCIDHSFTCNSTEPSPESGFDDVTSAVGTTAPRVRNKAEDVRLVQSLLSKITFAKGGPETPLKTDGICGKLTIAAIGRFQLVEMKVQFPDSIVDPEGRTIYRLNELTTSASETNDSLRALYRTHIDGARSMIEAGLRVVQFAMAQSSLPNPLLGDPKGTRLLNYHFKHDKARDPRRHLVIIDRVLRDMHAITAYEPKGPNQKPGFGFLESGIPSGGKGILFAFAYSEGAKKSGRVTAKGMRVDYIYLTRRTLGLRSEAIGDVITHELAHFVGNVITGARIADPAYLHRQKALYEALRPDQCLANADSYSQFCNEAMFGATFAP
jgi:hypothetical protein